VLAVYLKVDNDKNQNLVPFSFSCCLIGNSSLVIEVAEKLNVLGVSILYIFTDNPVVTRWADLNNKPVLPLSTAKHASKYPEKIDFLFSVFNPYILSREIIDLPRIAAINYHNSYLPSYRGQNATSWAILNNEDYHGYTWHLIVEEIDAGSIIIQEKIGIEDTDTALSLNIKCFQQAIQKLPQVIETVLQQKCYPQPAAFGEVRCHRAFDSLQGQGVVAWDWSAENIMRMFRGLVFNDTENSMTTPKFKLIDRYYIIEEASIVSKTKEEAACGEIIQLTESSLTVATSTKAVRIKCLRELNGKDVEWNTLVERHALAVGVNIDTTNVSQKCSYEHAIKTEHNNEKYWVKALTQMEPSALIQEFFCANIPEGEAISTQIHLMDFSYLEKFYAHSELSSVPKQIVALSLLLLYLYKANNYNNFTVFVKLDRTVKSSSNFSAPYVPFAINISADSSFFELVQIVQKTLEQIRALPILRQDIYYRYKHLRDIDHDHFISIDLSQDSSDEIEEYHCSCHLKISTTVATLTSPKEVNPVFQLTAARLQYLASSCAEKPQQKLHQHNVGKKEDIYAFYSEKNKSHHDLTQYHSISKVFSSVAKKFSSKTALIDASTRHTYTYGALEKISNKFASLLEEYTVYRNKGLPQNIGVFSKESLDSIVSLLAILKTGNCYVPISRLYPVNTVKNLVSDAKIKIILVDEDCPAIFRDVFVKMGLSVLVISELILQTKQIHSPYYQAKDTSSSDAYIMFTSGSTGSAKGVLIKQLSILRLVKDCEFTPLTADKVIANTSSLSFDASTYTVWGALLNGATLVQLDKDIVLDTPVLKQHIIDYNVDIMWLTARMLDIHFNTDKTLFSHLNYLIAGGDALNVDIINALNDYLKDTPCQVLNGYGPTENTTFTTTYQIVKGKQYTRSIPIGKPIANTQAYVLDKYMHLLPVDMIGELYVSGDGLAAGYFNAPKLTRERFIKPTGGIAEYLSEDTVLYKTGDLVRWNQEGNIEYIGRVDNQIKVRGFRVEIENIVNTLKSLSSVRECDVIIMDCQEKGKKIIAFLVVEFAHQKNVSKIRSSIKKKLPEYMLPSEILFLTHMPLNTNGKIDKNRLKFIYKERIKNNDIAANSTDILPVKLKQIWSKLLNTEAFGVDDSFFDLGGFSLLVISMLNEVEKIFKTRITISSFLQDPTISNIMLLLNRQADQDLAAQNYNAIRNDIRRLAGSIPIINGEPAADGAVLVTGANGYLGGYLLEYLLENTSATIYCLVRSNLSLEALIHTNQSLSRTYYLKVGSLKNRLVLLRGDLSKSLMGLEQSVYDKVARQVSVIYHLAASVNHLYPYTALRKVNVEGTVEVLKFANTHSPKLFNFISTLSAVPVKHKDSLRKEVLMTSIADSQLLNDGYSQSKWVCEYILNKAHQKGQRLNIFRPGWILGDSRTGYVPPLINNHLLSLIKSCVQLEVAPDWNISLHFLPVNFVASAIFNISMTENKKDIIFNLNNVHGISWLKFIEVLNEFGYNIDEIPVAEWQNKHIQNINSNNAIYPFKELYLSSDAERVQGADLTEHTIINNTLKCLHNKGIIMPKLDSELVKKYIDSLMLSKFLPPIKNVFLPYLHYMVMKKFQRKQPHIQK
jgi:amino acid adenylation domain-containing protein/thioester reductase-like protein